MLVIPETGAPFRTQSQRRQASTPYTSMLEDSVFDSSGVKKKLDASNEVSSKSLSCTSFSSLSQSLMEGKKKSVSIVLVLIVVLSLLGIGAYLYLNMETCAIFDVDVVKLSHKLEDNVFGQHIAVKSVIDSLEKFKVAVKEKTGNRRLVLSFHGWTGTGKNYISRFIAEAFYNVKFSLYLAPLHFARLEPNDEGKATLKSWIAGNLTSCGVNVLVFDEVDKASQIHLEAIQEAILGSEAEIVKDPELENNESEKPIVVVLFLSNSKASQINNYLFSQVLLDRDRDLIRKSEFDDIFAQSDNEWYSEIGKSGVVEFIPFLPLAEVHVRQCIERDFVHKGRDPGLELVSAVMAELSFFDMGGKSGQISLTGCKRVSDKVDLHIHD